jgi:hypothetical protein
MGKWLNDDEFYQLSHLNKPPTILLNAEMLLQSDHDFGRAEMNNFVQCASEKLARTNRLREYRFPGRNQDCLFNKDYPHVRGETCSSCNMQRTEKRIRRESIDPVVHHGLIASANVDMRSARLRDRLRNDWDVMCFETEAAAIMDIIPSIVIKGISDYSDGHKNKLWQPYAAVSAAAYAKDLLRVIHPKK